MEGLKLAETVAKLRGVAIQTRELMNDVLLVTYDIPVTEDGKEARQKFLKIAPRIGAVMHSRSVYLMPNTQQAQMAAVELSNTVGGEVYIWTTKIEGEQAQKITAFYDKKINEQIDKIFERLDKEQKLIEGGKDGMADRMHRKSINLFNQVLFSCVQRGSGADVIDKLGRLEARLFIIPLETTDSDNDNEEGE